MSCRASAQGCLAHRHGLEPPALEAGGPPVRASRSPRGRLFAASSWATVPLEFGSRGSVRALRLTERGSFLGEGTRRRLPPTHRLFRPSIRAGGGIRECGRGGDGCRPPTVVFSDGGGLTEHVIDGVTGRVVEGADELARAMTELAGDSSRRENLVPRDNAMSVGVLARRMSDRYEAVLRPRLRVPG